MEYPTKLQINNFHDFLDKFNFTHNLKSELSKKNKSFLSEGDDWLIELTNGDHIYIEKCSYMVKNPEVKYIWVDYSKEKGVTIEINFTNETSKVFVVITPEEIRSELVL